MVSNLNTLLTVPLFQQYTTNYYYANPYKQLSATTLNTLPQRISQVEMSLNSQLNGRLYKKYNRNNLVFYGNENLSPEDEEQTLYHCLTLCVEYNLETGIYVNLSNSYSGNVNGTNNFSTNNSNVIGMRNDIRDMLSILGLFNNAVIGQVKPNGVNNTDTINPYINATNLHGLVRFIETYNWILQGKITFINPDTLMIGNESFSQWVQQFIQFPYNSILVNYVTNNQPIPYMTTTQVNYWDSQIQSFSNILSNYTTQTIPFITLNDIARWNSLVTEENLSQLNQVVSTLQNTVYTQGAEIETNKENITTNTTNLTNLTTIVNQHFEDTKNVMSILQNYENSTGTEQYTIVPLISGADIDLIFTNQQNIKNLQSANTTLSNQIQTLSNMVNNVNNEYKNYSTILQNYLPDTIIPIITQDFINSLKNIPNQVNTNTSNITTLSNKLDNLEQNGISPDLVQEIKTNTQNVSALKNITNTNTQSIVSLKSLVNANTTNTQNLLSILSNYSNSKVPLITTTEVTNWNNLSQQVSTNTNNILSNTQQINLNTDNLNRTDSNVGNLQFILTNYLNNGIAAPTILPLITTSTVSLIYQNRENISQNSSAIQQNQQSITTNTNDINNLQQSYSEEPTNSEWEWLNNNNSYVASQQWVTLTTKSGKTIYRLEFKFALRNTTEDRFNMSNTGYIAQNYNSTGCNWSIDNIIGGWYFNGNTYEIALPNGLSVSKGVVMVNYGRVYVNGGANTNFTSGTTTFINSNSIQSIWVLNNSIRFPQGLKNESVFNFGWGTGALVCINTLLYLDFSIE